jgi:hypothetical protein
MTLKNKHKGKGNRIAQCRRKKERLKNRPPKAEEKALLIDGNYSFYPKGFCKYHGAYLTQGLIDTHRCLHRNCPKFKEVNNDGKQ